MEIYLHFLLSVIFLYYAWFYMWRRVHLEEAIDKLFDLRDEVRDRFSEEKELDSSAYSALRGLLNGHIKFIDEITLFFLFYFNYRSKQNTKVFEGLRYQIEQELETENDELRKYIADVRKRAETIINDYLNKTSIILILSTFFVSVINVFSKSRGSFEDNGRSFGRHNIENLSYTEDLSDRFKHKPIHAVI